MQPFLAQYQDLIVSVGLTLALYLIAKLASFAAAKAKSEKVSHLLSLVNGAIMTVVKQFEETEAPKVRDALGAISAAQATALKTKAKGAVKSLLGTKTVAEMESVLGLDPTQVEAFIDAKIEAAVHDLKLDVAYVSGGGGSPPTPAKSEPAAEAAAASD